MDTVKLSRAYALKIWGLWVIPRQAIPTAVPPPSLLSSSPSLTRPSLMQSYFVCLCLSVNPSVRPSDHPLAPSLPLALPPWNVRPLLPNQGRYCSRITCGVAAMIYLLIINPIRSISLNPRCRRLAHNIYILFIYCLYIVYIYNLYI